MSEFWLIPIFYGAIVLAVCSFVAGVVYGVKYKAKKNRS